MAFDKSSSNEMEDFFAAVNKVFTEQGAILKHLLVRMEMMEARMESLEKFLGVECKTVTMDDKQEVGAQSSEQISSSMPEKAE